MKSARLYSLWIALMVILLVALLLGLEETDLIQQPILKYLVLAAVGVPAIYLLVRFFFIRYEASRIDKGKLDEELKREEKVWADNQSEEIRKLKQMEKYRKDFLGNVSHELKTPLFNIQ